jgi:nicotinamidase-related amidase
VARRSLVLLALLAVAPVFAVDITLTARSRGEKGETTITKTVDPAKCAVVICDMWDDHWCKAAATRCDALAKKTAPVIDACRTAGMVIIHCPSDTMDFYKGTAARVRASGVERVRPPKEKDIPSPPLPIDDGDGGCDDAEPVKSFKAWTRQHAAIKIDDKTDYVTDSGAEVFSILADQKRTTVFVLGVHTNMCVLNRTFAIKQLRKWDVDCLLVRDLTDAMYNPNRSPFVSHDDGTQAVIRYVERHWCPSVESGQLPKR